MILKRFLLKACKRCKCTKVPDDFYDKPDGRKWNICKQCVLSANAKRIIKREKIGTPEWSKRNEYKEIRNCRKFGITPEEKFHMYCEQEGFCAICKGKTNLHIDHCHKTKKVRGLLCSACNKSIGMMREDVRALKNAIEYIEYFKSNPGPIDRLRERKMVVA